MEWDGVSDSYDLALSYNAWVMVLDEQGRPNNGPFPSKIALSRLNSDTLQLENFFEYYNYGHFMKFVARGAIRIGSEPSTKELSNVAFRNPDGSTVAIAVNTGDVARDVVLISGGRHVSITVPAKGLVTARWKLVR